MLLERFLFNSKLESKLNLKRTCASYNNNIIAMRLPIKNKRNATIAEQ